MFKIYKRTYLIFLSVIFLPLSAICSFSSMPAVIVKDILVQESEFFERYTAIGKCLVEKSREYKSNIQGQVDEILALQGNMVKEGEVIIAIDKELAIASKNEAEIAFSSANTNYQRDLSLFKQKFISEETLDQSHLAFEKSKTALNKVMKAYNEMIITAPFEGYVGVVKTKVGDEVKIGDYLFSIFSAGEKYFFVELPESLLGKINTDSEVYAVNQERQKSQGKVVAISNYVSAQGTLNAKFNFPADAKLAYGSFIEMEIIYNRHRGLALPEKALLKNSEGNFVYKIVNGKAKQEYVTLGTRTGESVEVVSGDLKIGDSIIIEGLTKIFDGADISLENEHKKEAK